MEIKQIASAGTMESSDVYVEIAPGNGKLEISLESVVAQQFGDAIQAVVLEVLTGIRLVDRGLFNTLERSGGSILNWKGLLLALAVVYLTNFCKKAKGWHPIVFIALSAVVGVAFGFAG